MPTEAVTMFTHTDPVKLNRVMAALYQMKKIDIAQLQRAYAGG